MQRYADQTNARLDRLEARTQRIEEKLDSILTRFRIPLVATPTSTPTEGGGSSSSPLTTLRVRQAAPEPSKVVYSDDPYLYNPLDASKGTFRVLAISGDSSDNAPIQAELIDQSLNVDPGNASQRARARLARLAAARGTGIQQKLEPEQEQFSFSALSYTWGAPDRTESIVLSGHRFPVTKNLYAALKAMRRNKRHRSAMVNQKFTFHMWIDAICVNQNDLAERAQQVGLMRRIYKRAQNVDVWLGAEADGSAEAMALIEQLQTPPQRGPGLPEPVYPDLPDEQRLANWKSLESLFRRPWWERGWVRQEVALGTFVSLHCGDATAAFNQIITAARVLEYVVDKLGFQPFQFPSRFPSRESTFVHVGEGGEVVAAPIEHMHNSPHHQAYLLSEVQNKMNRGTAFMDLKDLLIHMRTCRTTDSRDKVFSVLGLSDHQVHGLKVDYDPSMTHREVYTAAARSILTNTKENALDILCACQNPDRKNDLPSWVPNLIEEWKYRPLTPLSSNMSSRNDYTYRKMDYSLSHGVDVLRVKGVRVGQITRICPNTVQTGFTPKELHALYLKWQAFAQSTLDTLGKDAMDRNDYEYLRLGPCGMWKDQSWLTFLSTGQDSIHLLKYTDDGVLQLSGDNHRLRVKDERFVKCLLVPDDAMDGAQASAYELHYANLRTIGFGRRLAFTPEGCMGLVPHDVQNGDWVVWLFGGNVGYVLREADEDADGDRQGRWVVVGDAYLPRLADRKEFRAEDEYFDIE